MLALTSVSKIFQLTNKPGCCWRICLLKRKHSFGVSCMKKFLVKVLFFVLPVLSAAVIIEIALRKIPNDYVLKRDYLDAHSNEIETLILGTSHNFYGLDPVYFTGKTFNAAYLTQTLDYDYAIIKKYENKLTSLKTVVLDISYFSLYGRLETSFWIKNYVIYYGMFNTARSANDCFEILNSNGFRNCGRLYRYYIKKEIPLRSTDLGWGKDYTYNPRQNLAASAKDAAKRHTRDTRLEKNKLNFESNCSTLQAIIDWAKQKNIQLLLLTTPAYTTYREAIDTTQLNTTIKKVNELAAKTTHCRYFNLLSDTTFTRADFFDSDHLDEAGAKKLSFLINEKINAAVKQ